MANKNDLNHANYTVKTMISPVKLNYLTPPSTSSTPPPPPFQSQQLCKIFCFESRERDVQLRQRVLNHISIFDKVMHVYPKVHATNANIDMTIHSKFEANRSGHFVPTI